MTQPQDDDLRSHTMERFGALSEHVRRHGTEPRFLTELLASDSELGRKWRVAQTGYRFPRFATGFTLPESIYLSFLMKADRTLDMEELGVILSDNGFPKDEVEDGIWHFLSDQSKMDDPDFEMVNPATRNLEYKVVCTLLPNREYFYFDKYFSKSPAHAWRHCPPYHRRQASFRAHGRYPLLQAMPAEIIRRILTFCIRVDGCISIRKPQKLLGPDEYDLFAVSRIWTGAKMWRKMPPLARLLPLVGVPSWDSVVCTEFFTQNRFALRESYDGGSVGNEPFVAADWLTWLSSVSPELPAAVNNITLHVNFQEPQQLPQAFRMIGMSQNLNRLSVLVRPEALSFLMRRTKVQDIPGYEVLRRFRGLNEVKFIDEVTGEPLGGAEMLIMHMKKDVARAVSGALQPKPTPPARLAQLTWDALGSLARVWGRDIPAERTVDTSLSKHVVAEWIFERQVECFADMGDNIEDLRSVKRVAAGPAEDDGSTKRSRTS